MRPLRLTIHTCAMMAVLLLALSGAPAWATDPGRLNAALQQMQRLELDGSTGRAVTNLQLTHTDFSLTLESGRLAFVRPVQLDSTSEYYGAFFSGSGVLRFHPPVSMEQEELRRFFDTDSLSARIESAFLLFNQKTYHRLADSTPTAPFSLSKDDSKDYQQFQDRLTERENYRYLFATLRNLARPRTQAYLTVLVKMTNGTVAMYQFDPYEREEVRFGKYYSEFIRSQGMETVCQYSVYLDTTYEQLNGLDKTALRASAYVLHGTIADDGDFTGDAVMHATGEIAGAQCIELAIHPRLEVDSILDNVGRAVNFRRWTKDTYRSAALWVILNRPLDAGDSTSLHLFYHGRLGERHLGRLQSFAGADWYPRYDRTQKATFDITLTYPSKYLCIVPGEFVDSTREGRTLTSHWRVSRPSAAVSFDVGEYQRGVFTAPGIPPVIVYHLANLHRDSTVRMMDKPLATQVPESEIGISNESKGFDPKDSVAIGRSARKLTKPLVLDLLTGLREDESDPTVFGDSLRAGGKDMDRQVANDILAALRLYSASFGQLPYDTVRVVETMTPMGDVVPGIIHLGYETFFSTDRYGSERSRRGRGAALQWFGGLVNYQTYHDQWLSDGLATYCGMWFLQTAAGQDQFENFIDQSRKAILSLNQFTVGQRQAPGPVALGRRTYTSKTIGDKDIIIYLKGAYVLHMLRHMLLDFENMREDTYLATLRDYVTLLRDKDATTDLFRQIVEKHAGQDLHWFFTQWVCRSEIPRYTFSYTTSAGEGNTWKASGEITCSDVPKSFRMYVPIEAAFEREGRWYTRVLVDRPSVKFDLPPLPSQPKGIYLNPFDAVLADIARR